MRHGTSSGRLAQLSGRSPQEQMHASSMTLIDEKRNLLYTRQDCPQRPAKETPSLIYQARGAPRMSNEDLIRALQAALESDPDSIPLRKHLGDLLMDLLPGARQQRRFPCAERTAPDASRHTHPPHRPCPGVPFRLHHRPGDRRRDLQSVAGCDTRHGRRRRRRSQRRRRWHLPSTSQAGRQWLSSGF